MAQLRTSQLTIPEQYTSGLAQIASLPDSAIQEITSALATSPPMFDIKEATALISQKSPSLPNKDVRAILVVLLSLYSLRAVRQTDTDELVADISRAMKRSRRPELTLEGEERFRARLKSLLGFGALMTTSKAVFLQHEHEHTLCHARIFTDARPVYGDNPASPPAATVITHMLKIAFHEGGDDTTVKELHVALDKGDLEQLKGFISRAELKAQSLRRVFESQQIPVIE